MNQTSQILMVKYKKLNRANKGYVQTYYCSLLLARQRRSLTSKMEIILVICLHHNFMPCVIYLFTYLVTLFIELLWPGSTCSHTLEQH